MRRIMAKSVTNNELSLLEQLGSDYRNFKQQNPKRTARVPLEIKLKAREVFQGGASIDEMAKAAGVSRTAVSMWLNKLDAQTKRTEKQKDSVLESRESPRVVPAAASELATSSASRSNNDNDWVRIRIDGREIEVAKKDFWALLQSK